MSFLAELRGQARARRRFARKSRQRADAKLESEEKQKLRLAVYHSDAGRPSKGRIKTRNGAPLLFSGLWKAARVLQDNKKVFTTDSRAAKKSNFNIVFASQGQSPYQCNPRPLKPRMFRVDIPTGYDSPLESGLVFLLHEKAQISLLDQYNGCDAKIFGHLQARRLALRKKCPKQFESVGDQKEFYSNAIAEHVKKMSGLRGVCDVIAGYVADPAPAAMPVARFDFGEARERLGGREVSSLRDRIVAPHRCSLVAVKLVSARRRPAHTFDVRYIAFYG